ncbi:MAG: flagellar hook-associated protein FlgK, partial [Caulobacteraceae bacterium]|nr:flagellar hook-associated protein FlgK [Caulobacteraceae bacterium]
MTTLNSLLSIAASGMYTAQTGLAITSDNVSNVNTTGYVRKVLNQGGQYASGVGIGVSGNVTLAANQYLQNASLSAAAQASSATAISDLLNQAQTLFGDPSSSTSYLNQLNQVFSGLSAVADDPASGVGNSQAVSDLSQFLNQSQTISASIGQLVSQTDSRATNDVSQANQLLTQIASLNLQIATGSSGGGDATDAQNTQNELINKLSSLMDIKSQTTSNGEVSLTTSNGTPLVSLGQAATLAYQPSSTGASQLTISPVGVPNTQSPLKLASGEISGLVQLHNTLLPNLSAQLASYVSGAASAINKASNAASSVPAPSILTGRDTGFGSDIATAVSGFTGTTNIAIVDSSGNLQQQITVDFDTGTISTGGSSSSFTPSSFLSALNSALGSNGSASFSNGQLSIAATGGQGVAIADDSTTPSSKNGEGFSQYFGLNDLISSSGVVNYDSGLQTTSANGFTAGGQISLQLTNADGAALTTKTVTMPAGGTIQDVLNALNSDTTGVGYYGQFSLDSAGALSFTPASSGITLSVASDNTQWGTGGASLTQLFGIGAAQQATRTGAFQVRSDIAANPANLQTATLDLSAAPSDPVLSIGDGSGALAISKAGSSVTNFDAAGGLSSISTTVTQYAALLGGTLGDQASAAANAA